jgi:3-oxoadipate enol-lactonase
LSNIFHLWRLSIIPASSSSWTIPISTKSSGLAALAFSFLGTPSRHARRILSQLGAKRRAIFSFAQREPCGYIPIVFHHSLKAEKILPYLNIKDADIYYEVHGDGPPLLFCSVTGLDHQAWTFHQVPVFSRDHKVILFDYRGTGKSTKTVQKYSIKMFTDDAAALLDHLDVEQAIVCGHSMGGVVAQLLALDHPRKVKKLVLASSGAAHPGAHGIPLAMCRDMVRKGFEGYIREHTIATGWTKEFVAANPDLIEKFLQVRISGIAPLENYLHFVLARQEHDHTARLKDIHAPTLVLVGDDEHHGAADRTHWDAAHHLAREIPNAKLVVLKGEGHHYLATNPNAAHRAMREFIES